MKPFKQAVIPESEKRQTVEDAVRAWRQGKPDARAMIPAADEEAARAFMWTAVHRMLAEETVWQNGKYQVHLRKLAPVENCPCGMVHLSIKRMDRLPIHDWRDLQEIKNLLVGPEHDAVELYPAESRRVDTTNQYHLWVLDHPEARFPFGFIDRLVLNSTFGKAVQRPL